MSKAIKLLLCMVLFVPATSFAQDLRNDLETIISGLDSTIGVSIQASVQVLNRKGGSSIYTAKASIYKNASASYTLLGEQEFLVTKAYDIHVDHEEKAILILKKDKAKNKAEKPKTIDMDAASIRKLLEGGKGSLPQIQLTEESGGVRTYRVTAVPGIKEMKISLNMSQLALKKITIEYSESGENKGQFLTIDYTEFKTNTDVSSRLKTSRFFTEAKGKYVLASSYSTYRIYTEL